MSTDPSTAGLASFCALLSCLVAAILGLVVWAFGFGIAAALITYFGIGFGLLAFLTLWMLRPAAAKSQPLADRTL